MRSIISALIVIFAFSRLALAEELNHEAQGSQPAMLQLPSSIEKEHEHLHQTLVTATKERGAIGEAAKAVAEVLHPHFEREEDFALPPLALLPALARGEKTPGMQSILPLTDKLQAEFDAMLKEHKDIVGKVETLRAAAEKENRREYVEFVDALMLHARTEEDILYPASILVGKYLRAAN